MKHVPEPKHDALYSAAAALEGALARLLSFVQRYALGVVIVALLLAGATGYYVAGNLRVNTNTADMLSRKLPWRAANIRYTKAFPQYSDNLVVVVDGDTPDQAQDAGQLLADRLKQETKLFKEVYSPQHSPFFRKNQLLYLSLEELEDLADNLSQVQPFLAKLAGDQSLRGLFAMLSEAVTELAKGETYRLDTTFAGLRDVVEANNQGQRRPLSWQELMSGDGFGGHERRVILIVTPKLDFSKLFPGESAVRTIRMLAGGLGLTPDNGVRVRVTGDVALEYEELLSVSQGAVFGSLAALMLVLLILAVGFRSFRLVFATLITLVIGLIYTAGFATVAVGRLNFISVGFAMLYIGLGVEYAIHYCLRYREFRAHCRSPKALRKTGRYLGAALLFTAMTSAIGFYAFLPTPYSGIAELGLIVGSGMFISAFLSLTLLPALLALMPVQKERPFSSNHFLAMTFSLPTRFPKTVIAGAVVLAAMALIILPKASFDLNPVHLQDPTTESVQTFKDLLKDSEHSPLSIVLMAPDGEAARKLRERLKGLKTVEDAAILDDFVPDALDEKLAIIEETGLLLGPELDVVPVGAAPSPAEQKAALDELLGNLDRYLGKNPEGPVAESAKSFHTALETFASRLARRSQADQVRDLDTLSDDLVRLLPGRLENLRESLEAESFAIEDLPSDLLERWRAADGQYRIEVFPREDLNDNEALQRFVKEVRTMAPQEATGVPIINVEASAAVIQAFQEAFAYALGAITVLLLVIMKHKIDVVLALAPLLLAGILTGAATVIIGSPFNFANIITLPLILGISVDNTIHILHRYRHGLREDEPLFNTSAARGVLLCALANIAGLGNLAFSRHEGTASMGMMLTLGVILALLTSLVVLPALIKLTFRKTPVR